MKVLAINSSPKRDKGNTALILNPFLDGMREAGADVELLYTSDLRINPCHGDFSCWTKTPGICGQKDDMNMINEKMRQAEVLVLPPQSIAMASSVP
jgi:multimeric flavodoxin WrbA